MVAWSQWWGGNNGGGDLGSEGWYDLGYTFIFNPTRCKYTDINN